MKLAGCNTPVMYHQPAARAVSTDLTDTKTCGNEDELEKRTFISENL